MNQIGFDHILERSLVFAHGRGQRIQSNGAASEFLDQRREDRTIQAIEARLVHIEAIECEARRIDPDALVTTISHRGEVPNTP